MQRVTKNLSAFRVMRKWVRRLPFDMRENLDLACWRLGRSRALAGTSIGAAIADLAAAFRALGDGEPPVRLISSLAEGWADAGLDPQASCEDPLTGLATLPYLRTRLGEVYREARSRGTCPQDTHRLLVVELPSPADPWDRIASAITAGQDLRAAFPGGETLALRRPSPAIALVTDRPGLPLRFAALRRGVRTALGARASMVPLPGRPEEADRLLDGLAR
jgi:hypothetical protein